eukprot:TRINITY_DN6393_c0_g1_i3.p1 TRINITY_DN6393_c0_g1~~TRINITY_DN6393_c0_g1_i3.p1  ORF type:complete len:149 (-),score=23.07 TRINITY_DN6393_c0_g1_i3:97-495(-)
MPTTLFERQRALTNFIALMTGVMLVTNFEDLANPKHGDHDQNVDELISWCDGWNSQCGDHKGNPDKNATLLFFCDDNAIDTLLYDFHNVTASTTVLSMVPLRRHRCATHLPGQLEVRLWLESVCFVWKRSLD